MNTILLKKEMNLLQVQPLLELLTQIYLQLEERKKSLKTYLLDQFIVCKILIFFISYNALSIKVFSNSFLVRKQVTQANTTKIIGSEKKFKVILLSSVRYRYR